jgi:hypothetical protein
MQTIETVTELRAAFWKAHPQYTQRGRAKQNSYPADVRCTWCDFIDNLHSNKEITDSLADRATL